MNTGLIQATLASQIVEAIQMVVGHAPVALHEPTFAGNEWKYVKECLDTGWVSSAGKFVDRFEADLAAYTGARYAVAVVNGTAALHVALRLAGVLPGDEVLIPALTFVATANAVAYCEATPHFVDSEERTLGVSPQRLREYLQSIACIHNKQCVNRNTGRTIRALVPMHTFGHPADIEGLLAVARDFHLALVEDAAESLGSTIHGRHTGTFGLMGILSFNGNKIITTGGGGAILTNDPELARHAKHLTTTAKVPHRWSFVHDEIGYNYRLPNINAALGCAQLEQISEFIKNKRALAENYQKVFVRIGGIRFFIEPDFARSNCWLNALLLDRSFANQRDTILDATNSHGFITRPVWNLMHKTEMYKFCPKMDNLDIAEDLEQRLINIPSSANLGGIRMCTLAT